MRSRSRGKLKPLALTREKKVELTHEISNVLIIKARKNIYEVIDLLKQNSIMPKLKMNNKENNKFCELA